MKKNDRLMAGRTAQHRQTTREQFLYLLSDVAILEARKDFLIAELKATQEQLDVKEQELLALSIQGRREVQA